MKLAPEVILSNQVDNKILAIITKPSKMLERTLAKGSEELIYEVHSLCHHIAMVPIDFLLVGLASWR